MKRIHSFVWNGGVLIVMGGPSAFGTGGYGTNPLLKQILPLESRAFDLQPAAGKEEFDKGTPICGQGITAGQEPYVYWLHRGVKLHPEASVLWKTGNAPRLAQRGKALAPPR